MIRYLKHNDIDKSRWDATINKASSGIIYAKSWYLDIVSPSWEALVEDDYRAVFPLTWRRKFSFYYLFQPFFTQQLGIFKEPSNEGATLNETEITNFLNAIPEKYKFIEIQLNYRNNISTPTLLSGVKSNRRLTHHLSLNETYEAIRSHYSENLTRNIKKATRNNLVISNNFKLEELIDLFRSTKGESIEGLKEGDYQTLERLLNTASEKNLLSKSGIFLNNKLVAAAIFIHSIHEYIFLFSATDQQAKESGAMSLIIDNFIQQHAGENKNLDFEGSMDAGVARFYKSFGSKEVVYLQIKKNRLPLLLRWMK